MKDNKKIGIILAIIVVAVVGAIIIFNRDSNNAQKWNGVAGTSLDVALAFHSEWIGLKNAENKAASTTELLARAPLAESLKTMLAGATTADVDPVACRAFEEAQSRTQIVFEREDAAQYIMQATAGELTEGYAIVDLVGKEGKWQIESITCAYGDVAPEVGEFSYEQEGTIAKESLVAPYNKDIFHLIFQVDEQVNITPLNFTKNSKCVADGKEVSCDNFLFEGKEVKVFGQMTETGAEVARVEAK